MNSIVPLTSNNNSQYQKLCNLDINQSIRSCEIKKKIYFIAAKTYLFIGIVLLAYVAVKTSLAVALILGPASKEALMIASFSVIGSVTIYKNFFLKGFENERLGILFGYSSCQKYVKKYGERIKLQSAARNKMTQPHQKKITSTLPIDPRIVAQIECYEERIEKAHIEMHALKENIEKINSQIKEEEKEGPTKELDQQRATRTSALITLYETTVKECIFPKTQAAYLYHIAQNQAETRAYEDFLTFKPTSCREALEANYLNPSNQKSLFVSSTVAYSKLNHQKKSWTIGELMDKDPKALSKELFSIQ